MGVLTLTEADSHWVALGSLTPALSETQAKDPGDTALAFTGGSQGHNCSQLFLQAFSGTASPQSSLSAPGIGVLS